MNFNQRDENKHDSGRQAESSKQQWTETQSNIPESATAAGELERKSPNSSKKRQFWLGLAVTAIIVGTVFFGNSGSYTMQDVQSNGIGAGIQAGTKLTAMDEDAGLMPRDFTVEMKGNIDSSRALIWDFAAEDGDVVTVKVNNAVIAENIEIMNKPIVLDIPVPGVVEVIGVKDGVGGITYGIKFAGAASNRAYFNVAPEGASNIYTVTGAVQ